MDTTYGKPDTLLGTALAPLDWTRSVGLALTFSLLIAASAQVKIPTWPVPITGQTFAVLLTGALLGSRLGAAAVIALAFPEHPPGKPRPACRSFRDSTVDFNT